MLMNGHRTFHGQMCRLSSIYAATVTIMTAAD